MECCGRERSTRFCPQCGKPIRGTWDGLIKYLKKAQARTKNQASRGTLADWIALAEAVSEE